MQLVSDDVSPQRFVLGKRALDEPGTWSMLRALPWKRLGATGFVPRLNICERKSDGLGRRYCAKFLGNDNAQHVAAGFS